MGADIERMQVVLVNLISPHLAYDQNALASQTLARYLHARVPDVTVNVVDMQAIYNNKRAKTNSNSEALASAGQCVVDTIRDTCAAGPSIIGLSVKWQTKQVASEIVMSIQRDLTDRAPLFLLGNIGTTLAYQELLSHHPFTDTLAVVGEGEDALVSIVERAKANLPNYRDKKQYIGIPNVAINVDGKLEEFERQVVDLALYPRFDSEYDFRLRGEVSPSATYNLETSRGCPWGKCTFCSIETLFMVGKPPTKMRQSGWRPFPTRLVLDHIYAVAKTRGVRSFDISDSEFLGYIGVGSKKDPDLFEDSIMRAEQFAMGLIEINEELGLRGHERLRIEHISVRADAVYREGEPDNNLRRRDIFGLLKQAGIQGIFFGIESGSPGQLRRYGKGITVQENKQALEILRKMGFSIEVGFIFFDHNATLQNLSENLKFIHAARLYEIDSRILVSLKILAGSPLANKHSRDHTKDTDLLVYTAPYRDPAVGEIEKLFQVWEEPTRELIKTLPIAERLQIRHLDLDFMEDLVGAYMHGVSIIPVLRKHVQTRGSYLSQLQSKGMSSDKATDPPALISKN
ncbi:hypothetical protein A3H81_06120 [Candidatus Daviesbacteria bacterium RIFCSPLOWO2_02_FULL_38_18]|nr:MAG: hypothetical protein A3H81_06120 [Candidatus Daviesbacteria bacterium RIFCSPLOWO2_02_FULL_38_18]OGE73509.1 MAG: hypothetical protein A3H18_05820 [Candidatus Daviesbacteria bacterium RIFCSPLOWO2_12_FULL_38_10]